LHSEAPFDASTQRLTMFALRSFKSAEASRPPVTDSRSSGTDTNVADLPLSESLRRWCPTRKICMYRKPDLSRGHLRFCTSWPEWSPSDAELKTQPMGLHPCITTQTYPHPKATWQCRNRSPTRAVWYRIWPDHVRLVLFCPDGTPFSLPLTWSLVELQTPRQLAPTLD